MSVVSSAVVAEPAAGVNLSRHTEFAVASLRHFDDGQTFTAALVSALGSAAAAVPKLLRAVVVSAAETSTVILARRGMTETMLLCSEAELAALEDALAERADVAVVNLTGGILVWKLAGARAADLLVRVGSFTAIPQVGEALTGRLGEMSVMTMCVVPGEIWLLIDRVYGEHLSAWMLQTCADL